jgi:hypothetical protein
MAAEVEKLMEVVPVSEAKAYLKVRCKLPATELSTYMGFAKTMKGSDDVLLEARASFPVLRALVAADAGRPEGNPRTHRRRHEGRRLDPQEDCRSEADGSRGVDCSE